MDDATKAAALSAFRSILAVIGGILVTRGFLNNDQAGQLEGALFTAAPIAWGIVDKYLTEQKTKLRETVAVNAGIAHAAPNIPIAEVTPAQAQQIIATKGPTP